MEILENELKGVGLQLVSTIKGFLSTNVFEPKQLLIIKGFERVVLTCYELKFVYHPKTKILILKRGETFEFNQIKVAEFLISIGFKSKFDFLLAYSNRFRLTGKNNEFTEYLVAFKKLSNNYVKFEDVI